MVFLSARPGAPTTTERRKERPNKGGKENCTRDSNLLILTSRKKIRRRGTEEEGLPKREVVSGSAPDYFLPASDFIWLVWGL